MDVALCETHSLVKRGRAEFQSHTTLAWHLYTRHKPCCPAAIPNRTLTTVLPAVVAALQTPEGSQLHKFCLTLGPHGRIRCAQEMWGSLHIQVKSVSPQRVPGSADLGNSVHIDLFETMKNWAASSFHHTCGIYYLRKQN